MASQKCFVCSCFFTNNIFVNKYKIHVSYFDQKQFLADYSKALRYKGCVTEKHFEEVIAEVQAEVLRRRKLGNASLKRQEEIKTKYVPLHPKVYHLKEEFLAPEFLLLVAAAKTDGATVTTLLPLMDNKGNEVYTFPVFTGEFCQLLLEELDSIEQSECTKERPNTMNKHGVLLNEFGFNPGLLDPLRLEYLTPITSLLFPSWGGRCLDSHKAFTVTYELGHDLDLSCHFDNAEVTLNVALTRDFTGGDLYFLPMNSEEEERTSKDIDGEEKTVVALRCSHRPGCGVLHRGRQMHGAEALITGRRCNLVMWMRSSRVRGALCPMCGRTPNLEVVSGLDDGFRAVESMEQVHTVDVCNTL